MNCEASSFLFVVLLLGVNATAMEKEKVVPDVIDVAPKTVMEVKYGDVAVDSGNILSPGQTQKQPEVKWEVEIGKLYCLVMIDPDVPSPSHPIFGQARHWLIGNINGNDISTGEVINPYGGPMPPPGTGPHRYIFLVYQQPDKITFEEKPNDSRRKFKVRDFAKKYNLGEPVAGNFFQARWDEGFTKFVGQAFRLLTGK